MESKNRKTISSSQEHVVDFIDMHAQMIDR